MIMEPLPEDIAALRARHDLTQEEFGELAHASRRTVQNWEAGSGSSDHRKIPLAAWELLQLKLGELALDRSKSSKAKRRRARVAKDAPAAKPAPKAAVKLDPVPGDSGAALRRRIQEIKDAAAQRGAGKK